MFAVCALIGVAGASATTPGGASSAQSQNTAGGASPNDPSLRPAGRARLVNGKAIPPRDAPPEVVAAIEAANRISDKPYRYGGGHARVEDSGYDCSGAVSYALIGARLLRSPLDSGSFMRWGQRGRGRWITVYTNPGHAYVVIAGLRFDTGGSDRRGTRGTGPRWAGRRSPRGYHARHPAGF